MRYKTGQFARMMGVGVDTLRHYERLGLLSPQVDAGNGYRYYGDADAFMLLSIKEYRGLGMGVDQVVQMHRGGTLDQQLAWLEQRQVDLDEQIAYLQRLRQRGMQRAKDIRSVQCLGQVRSVRCPPAYHLPYLELGHYPPDQAAQLMRKWTGCMPFIGFLIALKPHNLRPDRLHLVEPGLKAELKYVDEFALPLAAPVRLMQGGEGVVTCLRVRNPFQLTQDDLAPLFDYFHRERVFASDDLTVIVQAVDHQGGAPTYYVNAACPVKKVENGY